MANPARQSVPDSSLETPEGRRPRPRPVSAVSAHKHNTSDNDSASPDRTPIAETLRIQIAAEHDITRRLRAQYAEISQLAGGLAHEIRNPLSTLSLNLDLLAEDFQGAESPRDRRV